MDLVERFSPQAEADGAFITEIDFSETFKGVDLGPERGKDNFLFHAKRACHELDITVGYRETAKGFMLGFETQEDHDRFTAIVEPQMRADAERAQRAINRLMEAYGLVGASEAPRQSEQHAARDQLSAAEQRMFDKAMQRGRASDQQEHSRDDDWHLER